MHRPFPLRVPSSFATLSRRGTPSRAVVASLVMGMALGFASPSFAENSHEAPLLAQATPATSRPLVDWDGAVASLPTLRGYEQLMTAARIAQAVEQSSDQSALAQGMAAKVDAAVIGAFPNLDRYPRLERVHGHEEPTWLSDRGDGTAQAVLALTSLQRWKGEASRGDRLRKLASGLAALQRKDRLEYPFGAHLGWEDWEPMTAIDDGTRVPSTYYQANRAYAVEALAEAGDLLKDRDLIASAAREALGMSAHLVIGGKLLESFSPQPEYTTDADTALPLIKGYLALYRATDERIYAELAALATIWKDGAKLSAGSSAEWRAAIESIKATPGAALLTAKPVDDPITFQVMEAERGKVVNKAIETLGFEAPSGQHGYLASMGQENTFWMRFDVPTEDDYVFYLTYLQSDIGGGLVSVMMRIDGDKIFQVPLGDVDGRPIMRRKFVDGPRPLRAGPHSFGIRFSGLLMTKPALLDSVVVQPSIERREFQTADGKRLVLLRNVTGEVARTDKAAFEPWPPREALVVNGEGAPAKLGDAEDRRRRKKFITLPAYGVAILRLEPKPPEAE